jgi:hypothetical protein
VRRTSSLHNQQQVRNYSTPPGAGHKKEQKYEEKDEKNKEKMYTQAEVDEIIINHNEQIEQLARFYAKYLLVMLLVGGIVGNLLCELVHLGTWA